MFWCLLCTYAMSFGNFFVTYNDFKCLYWVFSVTFLCIFYIISVSFLHLSCIISNILNPSNLPTLRTLPSANSNPLSPASCPPKSNQSQAAPTNGNPSFPSSKASRAPLSSPANHIRCRSRRPPHSLFGAAATQR